MVKGYSVPYGYMDYVSGLYAFCERVRLYRLC